MIGLIDLYNTNDQWYLLIKSIEFNLLIVIIDLCLYIKRTYVF